MHTEENKCWCVSSPSMNKHVNDNTKEKKEKCDRSPSVEAADGSPPVKSEKKRKGVVFVVCCVQIFTAAAAVVIL